MVILVGELKVKLKVNLTMRFKILSKTLPILARLKLISYEKALDMLRESLGKCNVDVIDGIKSQEVST